MTVFRKWGQSALKAFAPTGVVLGALIALIGGYQTMTGTTFWTLTSNQVLSLGAAIAIVCGAAMLLRHEYLMRELDSYLGNEHARRLWSDGIPPVRDEYLRFIRRGDYPTVFRFWSAGIVNIEGDAGITDLHSACEAGNVAIVQGLLDRGANPRRPDDSGITALMYSAIGGHVRVAEALLQHRPAINATSTDTGCSALYIAAAHGHVDLVKLLIREGGNLNAVDHDNIVPMMAALAQGHWRVAEVLFEAGADAKRTDSAGATVWDYAMLKYAPDYLVKRLQAGGVAAAAPALLPTGSGFARTGKVRVSWRPAAYEPPPPDEPPPGLVN